MYNNPNNLPIVGEENSHSKVKQETIEEGKNADSISDCPYSMDSTFHDWWMKGFYSVERQTKRTKKTGPTGTPYYNMKDSPSW
jgi:hypothetical protein